MARKAVTFLSFLSGLAGPPRASAHDGPQRAAAAARVRPRGARQPSPGRTRASAESSHFHDTITLSEARSRLDQRRFSRPNTHFAAFFKIFTNSIFSRANLQCFAEFGKKLRDFQKFSENLQNFDFSQKFAEFLTELCKIL